MGTSSDFDFHRHKPANSKVLDIMFQKSPVAHIDKVKTPSLLCIGSVDRRVPQSQGIEYHNLLEAASCTNTDVNVSRRLSRHRQALQRG